MSLNVEKKLYIIYLVQNGSRIVAHLVELVNAADAVVGQDERARLQHILSGLDVLGDECGQADGARALAARVLSARHQPVDVLQQLRLGRARVAAQQQVDLAARVMPHVVAVGVLVGAVAVLGGVLVEGARRLARLHGGRAAEELEQDALLDVLVLEDVGRNGARQTLVDVGLFGERAELGQALGGEVLVDVDVVVDLVEALVVLLLEVQRLDVRLVDGLDVARLRVDAQRHGSIDARHFDSVARLDRVDQVVAHVQRRGARRLARRHLVGRLLQLDELLVVEGAAVVYELVRVVGVARLTQRRLEYATALELDRARGRAHAALEERLGHLGYEIREADDHAGHGDQLVDVRRVELTHARDAVDVVGSDAYAEVVVGKLGEVELAHGRVERLHHLHGIADELLVELDVEVLEVGAVEVEERVLDEVHLLEALHVVGLAHVDALVHELALLGLVVDQVDLDELLELDLHFVHVDVRAPDDQLRLASRLRRHHRVRVGGRHFSLLSCCVFLGLFLLCLNDVQVANKKQQRLIHIIMNAKGKIDHCARSTTSCVGLFY